MAVDVVMSVDASPSMADDAAHVQANLTRLSTVFANLGVDVRLVLVALHYEGPGNATKVCVPPPLGGATCGASNLPSFRHVVQSIESYDTLRVLLWTMEGTNAQGAPWAPSLRRDALTAFVPITDDDSVPGPPPYGLTANEFEAQLLTKANGHFGSAAHKRYVFFPVVGAPAYPAESPKCGDNAMATGAEYIELAKRTSGKWFSICGTDFAQVFDEIASKLVERVACEVALPDPPAGSKLDTNRVNVTVSFGASREAIVRDDTKPCDGGAEGWQYAPDGRSIYLCGGICEKARADAASKVAVDFGCVTRAR